MGCGCAPVPAQHRMLSKKENFSSICLGLTALLPYYALVIEKTMTTLRSLANVCIALVLNLNLCVE